MTDQETKEAPRSYGMTHQNDRDRRRGSALPAPVSKVVKRAFAAFKAEGAKTGKKNRTSLKQFARTLNSEESKAWFANKRGRLDKAAKKEKETVRGATLRAISSATKTSRRGSGK